MIINESDKLKNSVNHYLKDSNLLPMSDIVELYYHTINVTSLIKIAKQSNEERNLNEIEDIEKYIQIKFNELVHPMILEQLGRSTETIKNEIKEMRSKQKPNNKKEFESQAKRYEELRSIMSTKEFVEQYNKILKNS